MSDISRRRVIRTGIAATAGVSGVAAAARLADLAGLIPPDSGGILGPGETLTYAAQRLIVDQSPAREFSRDKISKSPYPNGKPPADEIFVRHQANGFADWKLSVDGMVARPSSFSIAELKRFPVSSQITHLACEEGWSYIAEWIGVPLAHVLEAAGLQAGAKYVVYASLPIQRRRWDSVDMAEALHPQTLITYGMNGEALPVEHGGPLRLRVPRHLGYKSIKFITSITVTDSLKGFGKGRGSSAADGAYSWYAGI
ncbi:MAG: molybdopterin-dependent oxidoreductase [Bryobacterales bacterium]|nr:molybdopterin-dependent oxidoreductase [Bryobacterales bacterium]